MQNRTFHISGAFKEAGKVNIEEQKANIEKEKANIESSFSAKTASHLCYLLEEYGFQTIFGRSDVQQALDLKPTRSTELLKKAAEKGILEPVSGFGKGKFRFCASQTDKAIRNKDSL